MRAAYRLLVILSVLELALILVTGCGGTTAAPVAPSTPATVQLQPGTSVLTMTAGGVPVELVPGFTTCITMSMGGSNSPTFPSSTSVPVSVTSTSDGWTVRALDGTLLILLQTKGQGVFGSGSGVAKGTDGTAIRLGEDGPVALGSSPGPASFSGTAFSSTAASGAVVGPLTVGGHSGSCGSQTGTWSLSR